jgi:hypothetical protein
MLQAKRLKDLHFTVEDGANGSWPVFSWGMCGLGLRTQSPSSKRLCLSHLR